MTVGTEVATNGQPLAFASCGTTGLAAVSTSSGVVGFFKDGQAIFEAPITGGEAKALAISPDESEIAVGIGSSITIMSLDVTAKTLSSVKVLSGHRGEITALAYSPDGLLLAAGDGNREIKLGTRPLIGLRKSVASGCSTRPRSTA